MSILEKINTWFKTYLFELVGFFMRGRRSIVFSKVPIVPSTIKTTIKNGFCIDIKLLVQIEFISLFLSLRLWLSNEGLFVLSGYILICTKFTSYN